MHTNHCSQKGCGVDYYWHRMGVLRENIWGVAKTTAGFKAEATGKSGFYLNFWLWFMISEAMGGGGGGHGASHTCHSMLVKCSVRAGRIGQAWMRLAQSSTRASMICQEDVFRERERIGQKAGGTAGRIGKTFPLVIGYVCLWKSHTPLIGRIS